MTNAQSSPPTSPTDRPTKSAGSRSTPIWLSLLLAVVIFAALLIFIVQNSQRIEIRYLGANTSIGFGVALLLAALAGVLLAVLVGVVLKIRRSMRSRA